MRNKLIRPLVVFYAFYQIHQTVNTVTDLSQICQFPLTFWFLIIYLFSYHQKDEVRSVDAIYKESSQHRALLIQKAMVLGSHHSLPRAGQKNTGGFPWQGGCNFHCLSSHTICHSHLGNLVSTSWKSQLSAVHLSSQGLNPVASSQPGDDLRHHQLSVSSWLHTTVPGFTSDFLESTAELPSGSHSSQDMWKTMSFL